MTCKFRFIDKICVYGRVSSVPYQAFLAKTEDREVVTSLFSKLCKERKKLMFEIFYTDWNSELKSRLTTKQLRDIKKSHYPVALLFGALLGIVLISIPFGIGAMQEALAIQGVLGLLTVLTTTVGLIALWSAGLFMFLPAFAITVQQIRNAPV